MKIAVDAMGGDNAPNSVVKGSIDAIKEYGVHIVLVGIEGKIRKELSKYEFNEEKIEIINAEEIITNEDKPVMAIRRKKNSSMVVGLKLLKNSEVDAFISAGNTGALLSGGLFIVGRTKGIDRPALATVYPTSKGVSLLMDVGANADCRPKHLQHFAVMGSIYCQRVLGIDSPSVGLVNIGTEEGKGNELTKESFGLLQGTDINFYGNVEARDIPKGIVDVLVCDGFVGNTILKLTEGLAETIFSLLKKAFMKNSLTKLGALMLKPGLKAFKADLDYREYGGAPLLGVKKPVIKAHGSSDNIAIKNAIKQAKIFSENKVVDIVQSEIHRLEGKDTFGKE